MLLVISSRQILITKLTYLMSGLISSQNMPGLAFMSQKRLMVWGNQKQPIFKPHVLSPDTYRCRFTKYGFWGAKGATEGCSYYCVNFFLRKRGKFTLMYLKTLGMDRTLEHRKSLIHRCTERRRHQNGNTPLTIFRIVVLVIDDVVTQDFKTRQDTANDIVLQGLKERWRKSTPFSVFEVSFFHS